jgi:hypothetical protein
MENKSLIITKLPFKARLFQCIRCEDKECERKKHNNKVVGSCKMFMQNGQKPYKNQRRKRQD